MPASGQFPHACLNLSVRAMTLRVTIGARYPRRRSKRHSVDHHSLRWRVIRPTAREVDGGFVYLLFSFFFLFPSVYKERGEGWRVREPDRNWINRVGARESEDELSIYLSIFESEAN